MISIWVWTAWVKAAIRGLTDTDQWYMCVLVLIPSYLLCLHYIWMCIITCIWACILISNTLDMNIYTMRIMGIISDGYTQKQQEEATKPFPAEVVVYDYINTINNIAGITKEWFLTTVRYTIIYIENISTCINKEGYKNENQCFKKEVIFLFLCWHLPLL